MRPLGNDRAGPLFNQEPRHCSSSTTLGTASRTAAVNSAPPTANRIAAGWLALLRASPSRPPARRIRGHRRAVHHHQFPSKE
jgi:hypothetical protein